jgi:transcriptional regulator with XRE-family HTH domain
VNGQQLKEARHKLGLTQEEFGRLLGYVGMNVRDQIHHMETGRKVVREPQRRLVEAYLSGYRPKDWSEIVGR